MLFVIIISTNSLSWNFCISQRTKEENLETRKHRIGERLIIHFEESEYPRLIEHSSLAQEFVN